MNKGIARSPFIHSLCSYIFPRNSGTRGLVSRPASWHMYDSVAGSAAGTTEEGPVFQSEIN